MNIGPMGMVGGLAGAALPQAQGSDRNAAAQQQASQASSDASAKKAEDAAGIGEMEEDQQSTDRDADGRRLLEAGPEQEEGAAEEPAAPQKPARSRDPSGQRGTRLDLEG